MKGFVSRTMKKEKENKPPKPLLKARFDNENEIAHVALKVRTENGQTITDHANMVAKYGTALLGKMGQPIGADFRDSLNKQIGRGIKTYLFLTIRQGWHGSYVTYQCLLRRVSETLDEEKKAFVPKYYAHESSSIKTWFEIASVHLLSRDEMNKIFVLSSGRSIMSVVNSSATIFRVGVQ